MMYVRYAGQFLSRSNVVWRVDILQEADSPYPVIGELAFDADDAVTIEWEEKDKDEPLCGSLATLKIISPGDRTYVDLYTIKPGNIRCDIYRNGVIYWRGFLDPEFYEEPYEQMSQYDVNLTFTDFGIFERLKYNLSGLRTTEEILLQSLERAGLSELPIDRSLVTTTFEDGQSISNGGLSVRSENFYDEDGEPMKLNEVLEGILKPLGIRMIQRNGVIYLYDINGMYNSTSSKEIVWDGDSQTLSVDKVYNNVSVSFSPYANPVLIDDELEYCDKYDVTKINMIDGIWKPDFEPGYGEYYSFRRAIHTEGNDDCIDFTLFVSYNGKGKDLARKGAIPPYAHIVPVDGEVGECTCILANFRCDASPSAGSDCEDVKWYTPMLPCSPYDDPLLYPCVNEPILVTKKVFLPKLETPSKYLLRIQEEILIDGRFNPFSDSEGNCEKENNKILIRSGWVFIPAKAVLYDESGKAIYHYSNDYVAKHDAPGTLPLPPQGSRPMGGLKGNWLKGDDPGTSLWLAYYDKEDQAESAGICKGWGKNRQCIGRPELHPIVPVHMSKAFLNMDDGEYMVYPPEGGYLEITIKSGLVGHDYGAKHDSSSFESLDSKWHKDGLYPITRWMAYKMPKVEILVANHSLQAADADDIEYHGVLHKDAKEPLDIDTICGTADVVNPAMKGVYYRTSTGTQIMKLRRADRIDHPEKLLIGTLYSQFADRKTVLSGTCELNPDGIGLMSERNQEAKRFMLKGEVQNLIQDSSDSVFVEISKDEYEATE